MVSIGDKFIVTKGLRGWLDEGEIVTVTNVDENEIIYFAFGENLEHKGLMNLAECERCFEKIEAEENKVPPYVSWEYVEEIINESNLKFDTVSDKCVVGTCELPNGFVIVESYIFTNGEEYSEEIGIELCLSKIEDKIMELETYRLMSECFDCTDEVDEEELVDCENCDDYDCEFNPHNHS